jgi:hypothetical protein
MSSSVAAAAAKRSEDRLPPPGIPCGTAGRGASPGWCGAGELSQARSRACNAVTCCCRLLTVCSGGDSCPRQTIAPATTPRAKVTTRARGQRGRPMPHLLALSPVLVSAPGLGSLQPARSQADFRSVLDGKIGCRPCPEDGGRVGTGAERPGAAGRRAEERALGLLAESAGEASAPSDSVPTSDAR